MKAFDELQIVKMLFVVLLIGMLAGIDLIYYTNDINGEFIDSIRTIIKVAIGYVFNHNKKGDCPNGLRFTQRGSKGRNGGNIANANRTPTEVRGEY